VLELVQRERIQLANAVNAGSFVVNGLQKHTKRASGGRVCGKWRLCFQRQDSAKSQGGICKPTAAPSIAGCAGIGAAHQGTKRPPPGTAWYCRMSVRPPSPPHRGLISRSASTTGFGMAVGGSEPAPSPLVDSHQPLGTHCALGSGKRL
jgi:hypothetical protein